jgi:type III secretion protein J
MDEDAVVPRIRNLVASSIPGLGGEEGRNKVSVVMLPTELLPPLIEWTTVGPFKVQAGSAGSLAFTLLALFALVMVAAGFFVVERAKRDEMLAGLLKKISGALTGLGLRALTVRKSSRPR